MALVFEIDAESLTVVAEELGKLKPEAKRAIDRALATIGNELVEDLKEASPKKSGRFAEGWIYEVDSDENRAKLSISNTAPYAAHVINPTRPHDIEAKNVKSLHFMWSGSNQAGGFANIFNIFNVGKGQDKWRFFKKIRHPGTAGNPLHRVAFQRMSSRIQELMEEATGQAWETVQKNVNSNT